MIRILPATLLISLITINMGCAQERVKLEHYSKFNSPLINESSGLVKSRQHPDLYWTHNDSGDDPRIFPIDRNGNLYKPSWLKDEYPGLYIDHAANIDWEDIATDDSGNLYIGAFGNNGNARRDLAIYVVPEPHYEAQTRVRAFKTIPIAYPDQTEFPPVRSKRDFDCEAMFWANGKLYLLSKNRGDEKTKLYRLDSTDPQKVNTLTLIDSYDVKDKITAADVTRDGNRIAVLGYDSLWIFEKPADSDNYLKGEVHYLGIKAEQCEAVAFDDDETLIITNEQSKLFEVPIADLKPISE